MLSDDFMQAFAESVKELIGRYKEAAVYVDTIEIRGMYVISRLQVSTPNVYGKDYYFIKKGIASGATKPKEATLKAGISTYYSVSAYETFIEYGTGE